MKVRLVSIFAAISLAACGGGSGGTSTSTDNCKSLDSTEFSCSQSLNNVVDLAMVPAAAAFADLAETLNTQVAAYCADNTDAAKQTAARIAWQQAMLQWQELDVMQFGPLDAETRSYIYTWPESDTCKVDETVVLAKQAGFDVATTTPPRRGLDALEYLLFNENTGLSCADGNKTTAMQNWDNDTSDAQKKTDRCDYAKLVAANLEQKATELEASARAYDVDGQNPSLQGFANSMSDALFYVDKLTKDSKLGEVLPAANRISFTADKLEFQYADINREAIRSNLIGALAVINGGNGGGLDDYLEAAGQKDLADTMKAKLQTAIDASADANFSASYRDLINAGNAQTCLNVADDTTDLNKLCTLDEKVKDFTDDLKGQFVLNLGFSTPSNAEGDND